MPRGALDWPNSKSAWFSTKMRSNTTWHKSMGYDNIEYLIQQLKIDTEHRLKIDTEHSLKIGT